MQRASAEQVITWKKVGGGSLRFNGKIIKPGQTFQARPSEISQNFRDVIIPMEGVAGVPADPGKPAPPIKVDKVEYKLKSRGTGGWYDVVDINGKTLNEKALKKDVAEKLIHDLTE